ncbi:hypothetical protein SAICODRAFT_73151 [Saitoella complicata NRRL Y-17804]|uniref:uncharacterized protein n=1 Tax=Saitoella complicata (strain BCRC 22490 / CBS 7301 / JCM 7358 / NBRC 10748 / NRRL Y-17804) TaxID=698492 RepID=UPI000866CDF8|nr:uncharacterized protein SAICODRAFT_73151 [Saitoella complicata NRRL Y-17804]ODQ50638.1 hypothetical protein SAICODRAFT_73151 [Saitoella complicata NRRL Y-17804]
MQGTPRMGLPGVYGHGPISHRRTSKRRVIRLFFASCIGLVLVWLVWSYEADVTNFGALQAGVVVGSESDVMVANHGNDEAIARWMPEKPKAEVVEPEKPIIDSVPPNPFQSSTEDVVVIPPTMKDEPEAQKPVEKADVEDKGKLKSDNNPSDTEKAGDDGSVIFPPGRIDVVALQAKVEEARRKLEGAVQDVQESISEKNKGNEANQAHGNDDQSHNHKDEKPVIPADLPKPKVVKPWEAWEQYEKFDHFSAFSEGSNIAIHDPYPDPSLRCPGPRDITLPNLNHCIDGRVDEHPPHLMGSYAVTNLSDPCFTVDQRYGPYTAFGFPDKRQLNDIDWKASIDACVASKTPTRRIAVMLRSYDGYIYERDDILNLRALLAELCLNTGAQYDLRILHEVKDGTAIFADPESYQRKAEAVVPSEFRGLVDLWSSDQMRSIYPGLARVDNWFGRRSSGQINTAQRAQHAPLQWFAVHHPEYEYFWNWELDVRYIGNYYELFSKAEAFARAQPCTNTTWKNSEKWFFEGMTPWDTDSSDEGIGEEADYIAFGPIFDPRGSRWYFESDIVNWPLERETPRRASIITNGRLSRRLLLEMHRINSQERRHIMCESFGLSVAFMNDWKAVYVPHPQYLERKWDVGVFQSAVNDKQFFRHEYDMWLTTYYFDAHFAKKLYDGWRKEAKTCRRAVLLHPIKRVRDTGALTIED